MEIHPSTIADGQLPDDEIVAAIVSVELFLSSQESPSSGEQQTQNGWYDTAKLSVQSLRPVKVPIPPRWNTIERLRRRSSGGFYGITGL